MVEVIYFFICGAFLNFGLYKYYEVYFDFRLQSYGKTEEAPKSRSSKILSKLAEPESYAECYPGFVCLHHFHIILCCEKWHIKAIIL